MKTDETFDVVIIGSGIGGMSCGAILSYMGYKVCILEKNDIPGGCMQTITVDDWSWNLGIQYLALFSTAIGPLYVKETEILPLITSPSITFEQLCQKNPDGTTNTAYQSIKLSDFDKEFKLFSDKNDMEKYLIETFKDEEENIKKFWEYVTLIDENLYTLLMPKALPPFLAKLLFPFFTRKLKPLMNLNFDEALEQIFSKNDSGNKIKMLLSSYWNFMGLPTNTNFVFWCIGMNQQMHTINSPVGNAKALVDGFIGFIEKNKGTIRWGKKGDIKKIIIEGIFFKKATGVQLKDGTIINAKKIVSAAGLPQTVGELVPKKYFPKRVLRSMKNHISVPSNIILRIGFSKDLDRDLLAKYIERTTYRSMKDKAWNMDDNPTSENWTPLDVLTVFPKFYNTKKGSKTLQTCEVISLADYQKFFKEFDSLEGDSYESDSKYEKIEKSISEKLMAFFKLEFPELAPYVETTWLTSPLSLRSKMNQKECAIYGIDSYKIIDMDILPRLGIKNLYLSGMDVFAQGITSSCGMLTASVIIFDDASKVLIKWLLKLIASLPGLLIKMILPENKKYRLPKDVRNILTKRSNKA